MDVKAKSIEHFDGNEWIFFVRPPAQLVFCPQAPYPWNSQCDLDTFIEPRKICFVAGLRF